MNYSRVDGPDFTAAPSDHVEQSVEITDSVIYISVEALDCENVE